MAPIFSKDPKSISILSLAGTIIGLHMFLIVGMLGFIFTIPPAVMFVLSLIDRPNHEH